MATYGPSKEFPAFFSPKSGLEVPKLLREKISLMSRNFSECLSSSVTYPTLLPQAPFNVKTSREAAEMIGTSTVP